MSNPVLKEYLDVILALAKDAGLMMLNTSGKNTQIDAKANFRDLVTETDKAIEDYVFSNLKKKFPGCNCIGEETYTGNVQIDDRPTFIVDPIDGTTNYIHQAPFCCISIGMMLRKELVVGCVYSPFLNKLYWATKNGGAFLNGIPIRTKPTKTLDKALIIAELGSADDEVKKKAVWANLQSLAWKIHGIRQFGSAALNICHVAEGACDAYFEFGCHVWDFAGGAIILTEAGGSLTDTTYLKEWDPLSRRILVAATPELAKQISETLPVHLEFQRD